MRCAPLALLIWTAALLAPASGAAVVQRPLDDPATALVIIDVQQFYFPGGALPLARPEEASRNAGRLLAAFRERGRAVVHVGHEARSGVEFHADVAPRPGEAVFMKSKVNAFLGTGLRDHLQAAGIARLVICGMQTHMCVEAAARAAADLGFECVVVADACATRDLARGDHVVPAAQVHLSTLSTLEGTYAEVVDTGTLLGDR